MQKIGMVVAGGLENAGGIGRVMGYVLDVWKKEPDAPLVHLYDPRGPGNIIFSPLHLFFVLCSIIRHRVIGRLDLLHINLASRGSTLRKFFIIGCANFCSVPFILHLHGGQFHEFYRSMGSFVQKLIQWMYAKADKVVVLGQGWMDFLVNEVGVDALKIIIIPNGVPAIKLKQQARNSDQSLQFLFLGRLGASKGVPELLDALASIEMKALSWHATIAGDGEIDKYKAKAHELGLIKRIEFSGWVDNAAVQALLAEADVLVLPSHAEGLPISVLEGLAYGLAIVTTPVGALPEWLEDGKNALLVPVGDREALTSSLHKLVVDDPLRQKLSEQGSILFAKEFDVKTTAIRIQKNYDVILKNRKAIE